MLKCFWSKTFTRRKNTQYIGFIAIVATLILASCQGEDEPTAAATQQFQTASNMPSPTSTRAVAVQPATATSLPATSTPIPIDKETPTPLPSPTPLPTATEQPPEVPAETVSIQPIATGLRFPTYVTHAFDDRLFITEQAGTIRIIDNGQLLENSFLDITSRVRSTALEQGLLSVAFHASYHENGQFYVNYTDLNGTTVVSRFNVNPGDPNSAAADSEEILLTIAQPFSNHNGGQLQFGPDGMLYIGMGDGGSGGDPRNNGQNSSTLLGSLLRIDVSVGSGYAVPPDNPFTGDPNTPDETWAIGLRNPWRFSFDRLTGDLYLADVGQENWEEVNFISSPNPGGQNFGWNIMEGAHCFGFDNCSDDGLILPVFEYNQQDGGCSISGGYVYRGIAFPNLRGNYLFADYCSGYIWSLFKESDGEWLSHIVIQSGTNISSFGEDANGELYLADHIGGTIYQIQP